MGGLPCTGVLVRTAVNFQTGANHKASQFINSIFVFVIVLVFLSGFAHIPMPVIASILMVSCFRLIPVNIMKELYKINKFDLFILLSTWLICIFFDGAIGLLTGGAFSIVFLKFKN